MYDELELDLVGDRKTALFFIISDTDATFNFLVSMAYTQLFNLLCERADDKYGGRLPVHVRCLIDEAANIGQIPNLEKLMATIRSREISACLVLQAQSQLKALYKDNMDTIIGNCDASLFLGGKEETTLKSWNSLLGKETIDMYNTSVTKGNQESHGQNFQKLGKDLMSVDELAVMDGGKCLLQIRGVRPFLSRKYDITKHPNYKYLSDYAPKNEFDIERFLSTRLPVSPGELYRNYEVTAEDLEKHAGEGYTAGSVIGRSGAEGLFESELKGQNGCRIYIVDAEGNTKEELADRLVEHGKTIKLTIDSKLQNALYEQFREDKSCSVAMNPYTGEVLALVSTPSYDNNDFIMGLSSEKWTALNEDENKPLYNRFRQVWCPGSTFKPITAAIGLESGAVDPNEDYGNVGLSWQKDASWGSYHVTTLHAYDPVVLENALIYSDNIYFAKAALKIGAEEMKGSLLRLGFQEEMPFEVVMSKSQYSNTENIETEIQLADSGYGQGQILVNPLHMACIYTAFCNKGNVIKPYFVYRPDAEAEYWIPNAFSENTTNLVLEGIKKVINDSHGTGYAAHRDDILLAGKTGTAEIKVSKEDTSGTELGWFAIFTAESTEEHPILIVSMVEDVKGRGGSGYVVGKDKEVLESWFGGNK